MQEFIHLVNRYGKCSARSFRSLSSWGRGEHGGCGRGRSGRGSEPASRKVLNVTREEGRVLRGPDLQQKSGKTAWRKRLFFK